MIFQIYVYRTLHLYLADHFESLQQLLQFQVNATNFDPKTPNELHGVNIWIIHVVGEKKRTELTKVLAKSPVTYDSYLFECFEPVKGM